MRLQFGATGDFITVGRITTGGSLINTFGVPTTFTAAVGDKYMLTCRGNLIEAWRLPSGGAWVHLGAFYDPTVPVAGFVGLGISEAGTPAAATNFSGAALTNGVYFPKEPLTFPMAAVPVGIVSPIVTLTAPTEGGFSGLPSQISANGVRVQLKTGRVECFPAADFAVEALATRWLQSHGGDWQITGGKLKPTVTGVLN